MIAVSTPWASIPLVSQLAHSHAVAQPFGALRIAMPSTMTDICRQCVRVATNVPPSILLVTFLATVLGLFALVRLFPLVQLSASPPAIGATGAYLSGPY